MPIIIKKKRVQQKAEPEPLVDPRPEGVKHKEATTHNERTPFSKLPVASSPDELFANPGKMRAPDPTACKLCGHLYGFPCHGESDKCMNARWVRQRAKTEAA